MDTDEKIPGTFSCLVSMTDFHLVSNGQALKDSLTFRVFYIGFGL